MTNPREQVADMYRAAGDAYARAPSCVQDPEGFAAAIAEAKRLEDLADAQAEADNKY